MREILIVVVLVGLASNAAAQQYQNLEAEPNGMGGYSGSYGRENFETTPNLNRWGERSSERRIQGVHPEIILPNRGMTGNTQRRCYATGNGNTICR